MTEPTFRTFEDYLRYFFGPKPEDESADFARALAETVINATDMAETQTSRRPQSR